MDIVVKKYQLLYLFIKIVKVKNRKNLEVCKNKKGEK